MSEADHELPVESRRVLIECLSAYDKSGNGYLEKHELLAALRFAGVAVTKESAEFLADSFDKNDDGRVQVSELADNWYTLVQHGINGEKMEAAFKALDLNRDGSIQISELQKVLMSTGDKMSAEEVAELSHELIMRFDKDGNGKFNYKEFVNMFTEDAFPFKKPQVQPKSISEDFTIHKMP